MEIEDRYLVSYLHRKEMKLPAIIAELAALYHEDAFDECTANALRRQRIEATLIWVHI
jgi:hypothetical protein